MSEGECPTPISAVNWNIVVLRTFFSGLVPSSLPKWKKGGYGMPDETVIFENGTGDALYIVPSLSIHQEV